MQREIGYMVNSQTVVRTVALVRFAVGWNLHEIADPVQYLRQYAYSLENPSGPRNLYQVAERVNLWWSVYVLAQRVTFMSGSPDACPDIPPEVTSTASL